MKDYSVILLYGYTKKEDGHNNLLVNSKYRKDIIHSFLLLYGYTCIYTLFYYSIVILEYTYTLFYYSMVILEYILFFYYSMVILEHILFFITLWLYLNIYSFLLLYGYT